ncbi:MAG TPA: dethiobiotin synthase [Chitinophagales bacterium]|nr:dethiobiotin synthase [Chitinophagales bacterium]
MRQLPKHIFVAGTGTGIGKTVVSAILTEALHADYWKPIQCGNLEDSDTHFVRSMLSNHVTKCYPEAYRLKTPSSPHYAAQVEGVEIKPTHFTARESDIRLVIEAAGGLMVPLSKDYLVIDLIKHLQASVILVSKNYLGSINHTLLSIEALKQRGIDVLGIVFNGENYFDNQEIIQHFTQVNILGQVDIADELNKEFVKAQAIKLKDSLTQYYEL